MAASDPIPAVPEEPASNRRKRGRVNCSSLKCTLGQVVDLSATGARIRGGGFGPGVGSAVSFQIFGPEEKVPVQAKVVWIKRSLFRFEAGVEFTGLSAHARRSIAEIARMTAINPVEVQKL